MRNWTLTTAIEFSSHGVRLAQAEVGTERSKLLSFDEIRLASPDDLLPELQRLASKHKVQSTRLLSVLPRYQAFLKTVIVPPGTAAEVRSMLRFEAEKHLPFPPEMAVIDFHPVDPLSESSPNKIRLVAAKRDTIDRHLELLAPAGLVPDAILVSSLPLETAVRTFLPANEGRAIIRTDAASWEIDVFSGDQLILSRGFPLFSPPDLEAVRTEITNSLDVYHSTPDATPIGSIYHISTDGSHEIRGLLQNIPDTRLNHIPIQTNDRLIIPPSLAPEAAQRFLPLLGAVSAVQEQVNLLPTDIRDANTSRRKRKTYIAWGTTLAGIGLVAGITLSVFRYQRSSQGRELLRKIETNKPELIKLARIEKQLETIDRFTANNMLSLDLLKEMSRELPEGIYIKQFEYDLDQKQVIIRARARSYALASKAQLQMGKVSCFSQVSGKGSYVSKIGDTEVVDFEVVCHLKGDSL